MGATDREVYGVPCRGELTIREIPKIEKEEEEEDEGDIWYKWMVDAKLDCIMALP